MNAITNRQKGELRARGYTAEQIRHMTAAEAHSVLANGHDQSAIPEITVFTKCRGPLTKSIKLSKDGTVISDGSACTMAHGQARRMHIAKIGELAKLIEGLHSNQALALGTLRPGLPDEVGIVTKDELELNGKDRPDIIARTSSDILFRKGQAAFALLDFDTKAMPAEVADRLDTLGGSGMH
jgi:hypothetical protein